MSCILWARSEMVSARLIKRKNGCTCAAIWASHCFHGNLSQHSAKPLKFNNVWPVALYGHYFYRAWCVMTGGQVWPLKLFLSTDAVGLVDYEYGGPNYLAFDIADHFCEFAGNNCEDRASNNNLVLELYTVMLVSKPLSQAGFYINL